MIRLTGIERTFVVGGEAVHALRGVSLEIGQGEYLSIMGPSGSGKSTLLNVIGLLDRPNGGTYALDGRDVTGLSDDELALVRREKMGFVFQFFHLVPRLSAEQNIELPMVLAGIEPAERRKRLDRLLADYGLEDRAKHRPEQLSGGQCQRVAIARAMSMSPPETPARHPGQEVRAVLGRLHHDGGTVLVVTHDPEIGSRARRRLRMIDGVIISDEHEPAREPAKGAAA